MKAIRVKELWQVTGVHYVRIEAMTYGFGCPLDLEFKDDQIGSKYILVLDDKDRPISTCRINDSQFDYAKIERVATVSFARSKGAGRLAILEAEKWIKELGYNKVYISSREAALGVYYKLGDVLDQEKEGFGTGEFVCKWVYKNI